MKTARSTTILIALLTGVIAMVGINNISILLNLKHGFYLALIIFFVMGIVFEYFAPPNTKIIVLIFIAYVAIFIGVAVDAMLDWLFRSFGRNLWGAEVLMWWIFSLFPLIMGMMFARHFIRRIRGS